MTSFKGYFVGSRRTQSFLAVIIVTLNVGVSCLRMSEVRIPNHVLRGSPARLECVYELDQDESLYSVKWYKDGNEFYRFHPEDVPPAMALELPGISVDLENSTDTMVTLNAVSLTASGRYRCEVLGEAPSFHTVAEHGDMTVVALPAKGPRISGGRRRYQEGETANLTCRSGPSSPAAGLAWFVNGEAAHTDMLRGPRRRAGPKGMFTTSLGLEFKVDAEHFKNGDMKLKCLATIATIYWRSNEESVEGERPQRAPALESRESAAQAEEESRADRAQATTLNASVCCHRNTTTMTFLLIILHKVLTDR